MISDMKRKHVVSRCLFKVGHSIQAFVRAKERWESTRDWSYVGEMFFGRICESEVKISCRVHQSI